MITSIGSSFWILFNISNPLLPLVLFKESEQSEMCLNSSRTKVGITKAPSIKPVWHKSKILPSIITDVSKTFGVASFFLLEEFFIFFSLDWFFLKFSKYPVISSLFLTAISAPIIIAIMFMITDTIGPNISFKPLKKLLNGNVITKANTRATIAPPAPNIISLGDNLDIPFSINVISFLIDL